MKMSLWVALMATVALTAFGPAMAAASEPAQGESRILPAHRTPEEVELEKLRVLPEGPFLAPDSKGVKYCPAEYDPMEGILFYWWEGGSEFTNMVRDIVSDLAQPDTDAIAYIVVDSAAAQTRATNAFVAAGADMNHVEFLTYSPNSGWIRDYGPLFYTDDAERAIVDPIYYSARPQDDAFPTWLGGEWGEDTYDFPLRHAGGNFLPDATGVAHMTELILDDNTGYSEAQIRSYFNSYLGVEPVIHGRLPTSIDGTGHIDMWMMILSEDKVVISEYPAALPSSYPGKVVTEAAVTTMESLGYTVYRIPSHNSGSNGYNGTHYTYTNAIIVNNKMFIPKYGEGSSSHLANDATALAVYQAALPDHTIIPIDVYDIIPYSGAMHCLCMHVPVPSRLTLTAPAGVPEVIAVGEEATFDLQIIEEGDAYVPGSGLLYFRDDGGSWLTYPLADLGGGLLRATLPACVCEDSPEFYTTIEGTSGKVVALPSGAPATVFTARVGTLTVALNDDFETNTGWTVSGDASDGHWNRGTPVGNGERGDPPTDFDGSGQCFLTDNVYGNSDVDSGTTYLTSPALDMSSGDMEVSFALWFTNDFGAAPNEDVFKIWVSDNDGTDWVLVETVGPASPAYEWIEHSFVVGDFVTPTDEVRVRFEAADLVGGSCVEAGIDNFDASSFVCEEGCEADGDMNGVDGCNGEDIALFVQGLIEGDLPVQTACHGDFNATPGLDIGDVDGMIAALLE